MRFFSRFIGERHSVKKLLLVLSFAQERFLRRFAGICAALALGTSARFGDLRVLPFKSK